jgi:hypothetical protein
MRIILILVGVVLIGAGAATLTGQFHYSHDKEVVHIGDFSAKVQEQEAAPKWLGIAGLVIGAALLVGGIARKS